VWLQEKLPAVLSILAELARSPESGQGLGDRMLFAQSTLSQGLAKKERQGGWRIGRSCYRPATEKKQPCSFICSKFASALAVEKGFIMDDSSAKIIG
jgi:hypothetical protein